MNVEDVPSPIDLQNAADARAWAASARSRPGRAAIFRAFRAALSALPMRRPAVLELGSGPGFLAEYLLTSLPALELTLLDFSAPMHALAKSRLQRFAAAIEFIERDFRKADWCVGLRRFDAVITNQSVHELRHKRHAARLHSQVANVLAPGAPYLVCDHFFGEGGLADGALFMTVDEQRSSLEHAGFDDVRRLERAGSLVLHRAARSSLA